MNENIIKAYFLKWAISMQDLIRPTLWSYVLKANKNHPLESQNRNRLNKNCLHQIKQNKLSDAECIFLGVLTWMLTASQRELWVIFIYILTPKFNQMGNTLTRWFFKKHSITLKDLFTNHKILQIASLLPNIIFITQPYIIS